MYWTKKGELLFLIRYWVVEVGLTGHWMLYSHHRTKGTRLTGRNWPLETGFQCQLRWNAGTYLSVSWPICKLWQASSNDWRLTVRKESKLLITVGRLIFQWSVRADSVHILRDLIYKRGMGTLDFCFLLEQRRHESQFCLSFRNMKRTVACLAANWPPEYLSFKNPLFAYLISSEFLSSGPDAASKIISKYIVQCDIPANHLGTPHVPRKTETENLSETGDDDLPDVDPETVIQVELEGLFPRDEAEWGGGTA